MIWFWSETDMAWPNVANQDTAGNLTNLLRWYWFWWSSSPLEWTMWASLEASRRLSLSMMERRSSCSWIPKDWTHFYFFKSLISSLELNNHDGCFCQRQTGSKNLLTCSFFSFSWMWVGVLVPLLSTVGSEQLTWTGNSRYTLQHKFRLSLSLFTEL